MDLRGWTLRVRAFSRQRYVVSSALHFMVWTISAAAALSLSSSGTVAEQGSEVRALFPKFLLLCVAVKGVTVLLDGTFRDLWSHTSIEDLGTLLGTALGGALLIAMLLLLVGPSGVPLSTAFYDGACTVALLGALRLSPRLLREVVRAFRARRGPRVVLVGRLEALDFELRRMRAGTDHGWHQMPVRPIGLLVEETDFDGARLRRVELLDRARFERMLQRGRVAEVRLVTPISEALYSHVAEACRRAGVPCRPSESTETLRELMERGSELLLDRPAVVLDERSIANVVSGRTVLVTGAGGSIGSELARQIVRFHPRTLILVDRSENALFQVECSLASLPRGAVPTCRIEGRILDVRDKLAVGRLFSSLRPDAVFHAAAHKHVPMMERHPAEAVLNNVIGTRTVADAAHRAGVESFVFISTDKAVNPSSVMGATKRVGELYIQAMARRSRTRFVAVRFGNVLGSNGSVVPIFIDQIRRGGPVTVTHPEMERCVMSIPEACRLVLQAAAIGHGGEVFILDMGPPVKIDDLARRLIRHAGLKPGRDVAIVYSGTRPGEKLREELMLLKEGASKTAHPSIWVGRIEEVPWAVLTSALESLEPAAMLLDDVAVSRMLRRLVAEYRPAEGAALAAPHPKQAAKAAPALSVESGSATAGSLTGLTALAAEASLEMPRLTVVNGSKGQDQADEEPAPSGATPISVAAHK